MVQRRVSARRPRPELPGVAYCPDVGDPAACDVECEDGHGDAVLLSDQAGLAVDGALQEPHVAGWTWPWRRCVAARRAPVGYANAFTQLRALSGETAAPVILSRCRERASGATHGQGPVGARYWVTHATCAYSWSSHQVDRGAPLSCRATVGTVAGPQRLVCPQRPVRKHLGPAAATTVSNAAVNLVSRSRIRNRNWCGGRRTHQQGPGLLSHLTARLNARSPSGWTGRVATSITTSTYSRLSNTASTVRGSTASTLLAGRAGAAARKGADRLGVGSTPTRCGMVHAVLAPILFPSRHSSPWTSRSPGWISRARRTTSSRSCAVTGGRPRWWGRSSGGAPGRDASAAP
jgi:hypothetical protein